MNVQVITARDRCIGMVNIDVWPSDTYLLYRFIWLAQYLYLVTTLHAYIRLE